MDPLTINHRYRVIRELGRGGMGRVLLVEDTHLENRKMALKTILPGAATAEFVERFRVEFTGLAKLSHPNIASTYDFGQIEETREHFFTTAFVRGVDVLQGTADSNADHLVSVMQQTLRGLDFVHSHGLLHNDLKASNILLEAPTNGGAGDKSGGLAKLEAAVFGTAGTVKLIDFGLLSAENTAWNKVYGTPRYLSPERIRCAKADRRSDLYSAGIVFYLLCARVFPFKAPDTPTLLRMHLETPAPSLARHRQDLPAAIVRLVDGLLGKKPEERFSSAAEALKFLGEAMKPSSAREARARTPEITPGSLVHRETQLRFLEDRFRAAASGAAGDSCVALEGPQGSGKTRLVEELRGTVQVGGGAFIEVNRIAVEGHLLPVASAVLRGLETSGASGLERLRERLAPRSQDPGDLPDFLEDFILQKTMEKPLLIHFDDFQSASETVRRFALELVHSASEGQMRGTRRPRLLVVISRRPDQKRGDLRLSGIGALSLEPFSQDGSKAYLKQLFGQDDLPESVLDLLTETSGGNPGLLLELSRELVGRKIVAFNGSRWVFPASLDRIPLPGSMTGILEGRIELLDRSSRSLLDWLSCASSPLASRVLAHLAGLEDRAASGLLDRMAPMGIVSVDECEASKRRLYGVAQRRVRELVSGKLDADKTRFFHQRIAQAIEEIEGEASARDERLCEVLAHHWLEAGNGPGFLRYAALAAASLKRGGDFELAAAYHRRIVEGMPCEATARKIQSLMRLSEMHELLWDLAKSRADLDSILSLGRDLLKPADRAAILRRVASLEIACNRNAMALEALDEARRCLDASGDPTTRLSIDAPEAWAAWLEGHRERSAAALERAEEALRGSFPARPREMALAAGAMHHVANLHHQLGHLSRALEVYQGQLALVAGAGLPQAEAATRCSLGAVLLDLGRHREAAEQLSIALAAAKKIGDRRTLCKARERLAEYHLRHGDLKSALQIAQVGLQDAEAIHHPCATASSLLALGRIYLRAGQVDDAAHVTEMALELHLEAVDPIGAPLSRLQLARVRIDQGQVQEARAHAEKAESEARRHGFVLARWLAALLQAEIAFLEDGRHETELVDAAEQAFQVSGHANETCELRLLAVRFAIDAGKHEYGAGILEKSAEILAAAGSHENQARARLLQALIDLARGLGDLAERRLIELEAFARNTVLPRVARQCKEALRQMAASPAT